MMHDGMTAVSTLWRSRIVAVLLCAGCVGHPVGPARTFESYAAKASTTLESTISAVETVRLLAATAASGNALGPYTSVSISEQEDTLGGLRGTFMSIQPPPDERSANFATTFPTC
jgi:hypothetical protein